jgi:hypothetical protein
MFVSTVWADAEETCRRQRQRVNATTRPDDAREDRGRWVAAATIAYRMSRARALDDGRLEPDENEREHVEHEHRDLHTA